MELPLREIEIERERERAASGIGENLIFA